CSRIPKCRLRPPGLSAKKSPAPSKVSRVLQEGPRSAEPPSSHGTFFPMALSTSPEASRVAFPCASAAKLGTSLSSLAATVGAACDTTAPPTRDICPDTHPLAQTRRHAAPCHAGQCRAESGHIPHLGRRTGRPPASHSCVW